MLKTILRRSSTAGVSYVSRRGFASGSAPEKKAPILGSAGGIGQPLSLLMKRNPLVSGRSLYDIAGTPGVAADISHINTRSEVAGVPQKPGMTRDDLFNINAGIVKSLCMANALVNMISNPVNSTVPIAAEFFKKARTYDEKRLFGVTMLDVATPKANLSNEEIEALTKRTQDGGTEVAEAKAGKGSATLSMAYAGAIFADACLKGLNGVPDVVKCAFVQSNITEPPFSASKVRLEKNGTDYEKQGPEALKPELFSSIEKNTKILRPLSPHLPVYKPQLNSTFSIFHRISGAFLTAMVFIYYLLYLKIGLICFTYESFYQLLFYSSKLILLSVEISALALSYHLYTGVRHLLMDFSGFFFLRMGRKGLK